MNWEIESNNFANVIVSKIQRLRKNDLSKIKEQFTEESDEDRYKKILSNLDLIVEDQKVTQKDLPLGFIGLAKYNSELLDLNKELEMVVAELNLVKKERKEKATRREPWLKPKRLSKRDSINSEIENLLIAYQVPYENTDTQL